MSFFKKIEQLFRARKRFSKLEAKVDVQTGLIRQLKHENALVKSKLNVQENVLPLHYDSVFCQSGQYARPAKKNVLFLNNSYYHFYYLAEALRKRGWDTVLVSTQPPNQTQSLYYHGEDINLYAENAYFLQENISKFFELALNRFDLMHFANDYVMSFFPGNYNDEHPQDIVRWKSLGKKIAYSVSGCNSGISKDTLAKWCTDTGSESVCSYCKWQDEENVCNAQKSLNWGRKIHQYCDVIFAEGLPQLDYMQGSKVVSEPSSLCLDAVVWHPDLQIPDEYRLEKAPGEILIYHAVGNFELRTRDDGKNLKGTRAVISAINRLKDEGYPVRLVFVTDQPNKAVRFTQVQCDIIVDQLILGRYGATAREAMMLGKPTICYINPFEYEDHHRLVSLQEAPIVSATEETVYEALKGLIDHPDKRQHLGQLSRQFALKWHSADASAERYEAIMDAVMKGQPIQFPQTWSYYNPLMMDAQYQPVLSNNVAELVTV